MRFTVKHEIKGRIRVQLIQREMTFEEADTLQYYLSTRENVVSAKVQRRTSGAVICYRGDREEIIELLKNFHYKEVKVPEAVFQSSGRKLEEEYWEKLVTKVVLRAGSKMFIPYPLRAAVTAVRSLKYLRHGLKTLAKGRMEVPVLDAAAVGVSVFRGDFDTAGSIMFLLGIGEILEEWTHKKSVGDLARSTSLNIEKVWLLCGGQEILTDSANVREQDLVVVHMGSVIPFDGTVEAGEAMVNQASLTGEAVPVEKSRGASVYAGTVVEEGELTFRVRAGSGASKYDRIAAMIEESEKLKSSVEGKAEHLADRLVPWTLAGSALTWLATGNVTKMLAVLMVDFSCALKLAVPISVLSAIREAGSFHITVKGGRYLEAVAEADTVVFDKTGTLTRACPVVAEVVSFNGDDPDELLRLAACMEEHFPHSMAKAVVDAAKARDLQHEEKHTKVEYLVAHGISTTIEGKRAVIGSWHFVFEDEKCVLPEGTQEKFDSLPSEYSQLYLAVEGVLAGVICIEDPLREEAREEVRALKESGISKVVMMTGDSERTACAAAEKVGVDEYYSEVLPEDKARFVEEEKAKGRKVMMIGDGINDSPALSASDVGIAISDGAELAREIADVTIGAEDLWQILALRKLSTGLMSRIQKNYRTIVGFNTALILLGAAGILPPSTSALLHNTSTLVISLKSMNPILG